MDRDIILHPFLPTACDSNPLPPPPTVLYKISIDSLPPPPHPSTGVEWIRCSAALFTGCMLVMYNSDVYMCTSGAVNMLCFVWKFSCIKFLSLIHACMYINDACNFINYSSVASQGLVVRQVLTEPKLQSL